MACIRLLGAGKRVTAVDIRRAMLERMYSKLHDEWVDRLTVVEDTAERLPHLGDNAFDGVTVLLAFFDMNDPIAALAEAQRVLKPGGTVVITERRRLVTKARVLSDGNSRFRDRDAEGLRKQKVRMHLRSGFW
jgi:ubiquinone/menaquinone biosynthesis C-methylase UbiE